MINFPFGTNGKLSILGVPILKYITAGFLGFVLTQFHLCHFYQIINFTDNSRLRISKLSHI